jgi:CheY-like chemotaxis protein
MVLPHSGHAPREPLGSLGRVREARRPTSQGVAALRLAPATPAISSISATDASTAAIAAAHATRAARETPRVLAIDDEPANHVLLRAQLDPRRYALTTLEDPREALRVLMHEGPFDAVLLDIAMPHLSGLEIARGIRRIYPVTWCPILFLSASASAEDVAAAFEAGGNDFLPKPIPPRELLLRLELHLEVSRAFREAVTPPGVPRR